MVLDGLYGMVVKAGKKGESDFDRKRLRRENRLELKRRRGQSKWKIIQYFKSSHK